jgi:hypothetical protein
MSVHILSDTIGKYMNRHAARTKELVNTTNVVYASEVGEQEEGKWKRYFKYLAIVS